MRRALFVIFGLWTVCSISPVLFAQEDNPLTAADVKSAKPKPSPRTADGHPDLSGYWKGTRGTITGNIGKDLPGLKLPLTAAGEAALQHNLTATIDPESLCIIGGIPAPQCERASVRSLARCEEGRLPVLV